MKLDELKKAKPATKTSSGTDNPSTYIGKWEEYTEPQGISDRQDPKVLAKESNNFGTDGATTRVGAEKYTDELSVGPIEAKLIKQSKKAPKKLVRQSARALSARGKPPVLNPYRLEETIRTPFHGTLSAEYEIVDDNDKSIGYAMVSDGVIETFDYDVDASQAYRGQIMSALLHQITGEADRNRANVSIEINDTNVEIKYLFERFGFRTVGGSIMRRNAGAIRPTSVNPPQGMINRDD